MSILHIHRLFGSSSEGWDELVRSPVLRLFVFLVVPCSLLPPLMLEYAGGHVGAVLLPHASGLEWRNAALFFLVAELMSVPLMAWAIQSVAGSKGIATAYHDAFALAAVAPVPLWLSSLSLFLDQPFLIAAIVALGVAGSMVLVCRGVAVLLKIKEALVAFDIAYVVAALGLAAWAFLALLALVPVLS